MDYSYMPMPGKDQGPFIEEHEFIISVDLGQSNDYTAISVLERIIKGRGVLGLPADSVYDFSEVKREGERHYHLRHLERPPRGTEYPDIVDRIIELYRSEPMMGSRKAVVIDLTGLGRPVYDLMKKSGFKASLNAISITGGMKVTHSDQRFNVPKRDLVTNLQVMLQNGSLRIANGLKEAAVLVEELAGFQVKITDSGHDVYGGRSGVHDDLVLSVAMGAWLAMQRGVRWGKDGWM